MTRSTTGVRDRYAIAAATFYEELAAKLIEGAREVFEEAGHDVFVADDTTQAMDRMRDAHVDVLVLDPEFDMPRRGAAFISHEMSAMRMPERRRVVFVQLSDKARTCDAHAAFLAGAIFGGLVTEESDEASRLNEEIGALLGGVTFLIFGAALLGPTLKHVSWQIALYAGLSLTVVRMLPVAIAMLGSDAKWPTVGFLGWFGPRGLAVVPKDVRQ